VPKHHTVMGAEEMEVKIHASLFTERHCQVELVIVIHLRGQMSDRGSLNIR
jgi:hypothetical protein